MSATRTPTSEADQPPPSRSALTSWFLDHWSVIAVVAIVLVQFALLAPLFGPGEPAGDDLSIHLAETAHIARALAQGDMELWNPTANAGFASGYYYQILPQLLPALLSLIFGGLLSLLFVFKLCIAVPLALLPATTYRALRVAGVAKAEAVGAAFAIGFVFTPFKWGLGVDSLFTTGLYSQAWGVLFVPLAIVYADRYLRLGEGRGRAVGYALLVGLCHPFFGFALGPAILLTPWWRAGILTALRRGTILLGLVLTASAFFWLPILVHYDSFGGFPARVADEAGIAPVRFVKVLVRGGFFDLGRVPAYTILLVPALALAVWRRSAVGLYVFCAGAIFALAVALGPVVGKTDGDLIPAIRFLGMMQLMWAGLAGMGAVAIGRTILEAKRLPISRGLARGALTGAGVAAAVYIVVTARIGERTRLIDDFKGQDRSAMLELIKELEVLPHGRILGARELGTAAHWWMYMPSVYANTPAMRAYGGAALQSSPNYVYLRTYPFDGNLALWGVRYVLARADKPTPWIGTKERKRVRDYKLLEIPTLGLFRPIGILRQIPSDRKTREKTTNQWLRSPEPAIGMHLEIGGSSGATQNLPVDILSEYEGLSRYDGAVKSAKGGTVALAVTYHPGWRATVDGKAVPIRRVSPDFMAVDVPPGEHMIIYRFSRPWWTWALLAVSLLALIGASINRKTFAQWLKLWSPPASREEGDLV